MMRFAPLFCLGFLSCSVIAFIPSPTKQARHSTQIESIPNGFDTLTSGLASICRLPYGVTVSPEAVAGDEASAKPKLVQLYDVENDRACRAVRERITELDLVVEKVISACPNSRVFQDKSFEFALPSGTSVPRLVVSEGSNERVISGEVEIVSFLDDTFSTAPIAQSIATGDELREKATVVIKELGGYAAGFLRLGRGSSVCNAAAASRSVPRPTKPLIFYSYEGNQFCRLVREVLTELDLVYELRSAGKESPRRAELAQITGGSTQCPYLIDPNTDTKMAESADIIRYLYQTYASWTPPNELLQGVSDVVLSLVRPVFSKLAPLQAGSYKDDGTFNTELSDAKKQIQEEVSLEDVVVYTYSLSPFSTETKALLNNLGVSYKEISLGLEWLPFLIAEGGAIKRAALLEMTGQSSLPHIFIGGKSIGGLFSGSPGLVPSLEDGSFMKRLEKEKNDPGEAS